MNAQSTFFENSSGATFSECGKYRYVLWLIWDDTKPKCMFIGLNPSTANASKNDNTITKVIKVAKNNGFGGIYMLNLFAIISPHPEILTTNIDRQGDNDTYLKKYLELSDAIVCCWGNFKEAVGRARQVRFMINKPLLCFAQNKNFSPKHPLYCKDDTKFIQFI